MARRSPARDPCCSEPSCSSAGSNALCCRLRDCMRCIRRSGRPVRQLLWSHRRCGPASGDPPLRRPWLSRLASALQAGRRLQSSPGGRPVADARAGDGRSRRQPLLASARPRRRSRVGRLRCRHACYGILTARAAAGGAGQQQDEDGAAAGAGPVPAVVSCSHCVTPLHHCAMAGTGCSRRGCGRGCGCRRLRPGRPSGRCCRWRLCCCCPDVVYVTSALGPSRDTAASLLGHPAGVAPGTLSKCPCWYTAADHFGWR